MSPKKVRAIFARFARANPDPTTELAYHTPYQLLVAVILSAQATDKSVNLATRELFKAADTPQRMVRLGEAGLIPYISRIGLYKAKAKNVTYDRIRSWISKKRRLGGKAEFLPGSGGVFKTATFDYGNRLRGAGGETFDFVSRMTLRDAGGSGAVTVLTYAQPKAETHAPSLFNINNVVR